MSIAVAAGFLALAAAATSPCESPANPVVRENCLPGSPSSEWDVNGAGSPDVLAFATRASVERGGEVAFKIKLAADEPLVVDVWRVGHYGGAGARKVGRAALEGGAAAATAAARKKPEKPADEPPPSDSDEDDDFYSEYSASKAGRSTAKHGKTYNVALTRSMAIAKRDAQRRR